MKKKSKSYYMYGKHPVFAAINNHNRTIKKIYCLEKNYSECKSKLNNKDLDIKIVSLDFINKKVGTNHLHQGILALVESIFLKKIDDLNFSTKKDKIVILDQINDPQNIGSIIRSAVAFGISKLILLEKHNPGENATIAKAASGCLELIEIAQITNLKAAIETLKKKEFWIAGLDLNGKNNPSDLIKFDKIAVVIGSEGRGMRKLTATSCDLLVKIPILDKVESLNASNAASIIFYTLNS